MTKPLKLNAWDVYFWPGGWLRATDDRGVKVILQVLPAGEGEALQLRLHTALMTSSKPITARMWREVPIAQIEMHLAVWRRAQPNEFTKLATPVEIEAFSVDGLDRYLSETPPLPISGSIPTDVLVSEEGDPEAGFSLGLTRPPGGRITDEFLQNIAELYRWAVESGRPPAIAIAHTSTDGHEVPVRTVHRWIAEARKRGFLPPAIKGKAG